MSINLVKLLQQQKIGLIGLGNLGKNTFYNLIRNNFNVTSIYDPYQDLETLLYNASYINTNNKLNTSISYDINELSSNCNIIITALPTPNDIKNLIENNKYSLFNNILNNNINNTVNNINNSWNINCLNNINGIWIDHSTTDYKQTIDFAKIAKNDYNIETLEAPFTGGIQLLEQGLMTLYVGGNINIYNTMFPLLQTNANKIIYFGEIGNASITKVLSNMLASIHTVAMGEAMMIAKKSNIDLNVFWEAIKVSAGNSFVWETEGPLVFNNTYDTKFSIALQTKDMQLADKLCKENNIPTKLNNLTYQIFEEAKNKYGNESKSTIVCKLIQDELNETLQLNGYNNWSYSIKLSNDESSNNLRVVHLFNQLETSQNSLNN